MTGSMTGSMTGVVASDGDGSGPVVMALTQKP